MLMSVTGAWAQTQTPQYKYHKYSSLNGTIYEKISPDGKWALVNKVMNNTETTNDPLSQIVNTATGEMFTVFYNNQPLNIRSISNEDPYAMVTVVGSIFGRPMSYYFNPYNPQKPGILTLYNLSTNWERGILESITPDGKYAVGYMNGYKGEIPFGDDGEDWTTPLYVKIGEKELIPTPGAPKYDRNGVDQHAVKFNSISADGRYVLGENFDFHFVYDTQTDTYKAIGFRTEGNRQIPEQNIAYLDYAVMSTSGRYVGALAALSSEEDSNATDNYLCRYDIQTGQLTIFKNAECKDMVASCINDNGTIFGVSHNGSTLQDFKIFYQDKHWISFSQICQQFYGFEFNQKIGVEFTGTPTSVTADGTAFVSYSDPTDESYYFNLGTTVEEICSGIDLLNYYTITPESGSNIPAFNSIEISFDRPVQVVGRGDTHFHLYKRGKGGTPDTKVCDGLSSMGESGGLHLKSNSNDIVVATVQETELEEDVEYYCVLDPGAIAVAAENTITNKQPIKSTYYYHCHTFNTIDDVCDKCGHGFLRYEANGVVRLNAAESLMDSEGNPVVILSNTSNDGQGVLEFDRPLVSIGGYAFWGSELTGVTLGHSVERIGVYAFGRCIDLNYISFPDKITSIGANAFENCISLAEMTLECTTPPTVGCNAFEGVNKSIPVHIPENTLQVYQAADGWKEFTNLQQTPHHYEHYVLNDAVAYTEATDFLCHELTYNRTFYTNVWNPWFVPFTATVEELADNGVTDVAVIESIHNYDMDEDGVVDKTVLEVIKKTSGTVKAGVPYMVKTGDSYTYPMVFTDRVMDASTNAKTVHTETGSAAYDFMGTYSGLTAADLASSSHYSLNEEGKMVHRTLNILPQRWYMKEVGKENVYEELSPAMSRAFAIRVIGEEDETTGIRTIYPEDGQKEERLPEGIFDLNGRKLSAPQSGQINIINGKKHFVR